MTFVALKPVRCANMRRKLSQEVIKSGTLLVVAIDEYIHTCIIYLHVYAMDDY